MKQIIDLLIDRMKDLEQENKQLKEQLEEIRKSQKMTFETLMQTYKELAIREKALELACKDIKETGLFAITDEFESFEDVYIKSAEQKLNEDN